MHEAERTVGADVITQAGKAGEADGRIDGVLRPGAAAAESAALSRRACIEPLQAKLMCRFSLCQVLILSKCL